MEIGDTVIIHPESEYYNSMIHNPWLVKGVLEEQFSHSRLDFIVQWNDGQSSGHNRTGLIKVGE